MGDVLLMLMVWCGGVCVLLFLAPAGPYSKRGPNIKEYWELKNEKNAPRRGARPHRATSYPCPVAGDPVALLPAAPATRLLGVGLSLEGPKGVVPGLPGLQHPLGRRRFLLSLGPFFCGIYFMLGFQCF